MPPASCHTGISSAFAFRSHSARSIAEIADIDTGPPVHVTRRYSDVQIQSILSGSFPSRNFAKSSISASRAASLYCSEPSPQPEIPVSVSIRTNSQFVPAVLCTGVAIRNTLTSVIFNYFSQCPNSAADRQELETYRCWHVNNRSCCGESAIGLPFERHDSV